MIKGMDKVTSNLKKYLTEKTSAAKKVLIIEGEKSIRKNFDSGGRPKWVPRKRISKKQKGTNILVISGALKNVRGMETLKGASFTVDPRARAYARIQQEGGVISVASRKMKVRKLKSGASRFAGSRHKKTRDVIARAHQIRIPARPYLRIPTEDFPGIVKAVERVFK